MPPSDFFRIHQTWSGPGASWGPEALGAGVEGRAGTPEGGSGQGRAPGGSRRGKREKQGKPLLYGSRPWKFCGPGNGRGDMVLTGSVQQLNTGVDL